MFFETPTQVKFWDPDGGHYTAGIAYKDEIIVVAAVASLKSRRLSKTLRMMA